MLAKLEIALNTVTATAQQLGMLLRIYGLCNTEQLSFT